MQDPSIYIVGDSPIPLWGLSPSERLRRQLQAVGLSQSIEALEARPTHASILLLRGDYVYDDRVIEALVAAPNTLLRASKRSPVVAAHVAADDVSQATALIAGTQTQPTASNLRIETPESLVSNYQKKLLKFDPPFVQPITPHSQRELERRLFTSTYKGVTDLITKWLWPKPARWATHLCTRHGIKPNHITLSSWALALATGLLFAVGEYGWGLVIGWVMTFLDTVDGKLARVTFNTSRGGDLFDHLLDLVHPPLWYLAWGWGLTLPGGEITGLSLEFLLWAIVIGYIGGRLVEGTFSALLADFSLFLWRPFDSAFRLVTARRNPNLILLTTGVIVGRPDLGLLAVALWTVVSTLVLLVRLVQAWRERLIHGTLRPWFQEVESGQGNRSLTAWLFTRN